MVSKPCSRAGKDGCDIGTITERDPSHLARRRYCSKRCAWHGKVEGGWQSDVGLTVEAKRRGGKKGARTSASNRHRTALTRAVQACGDLIPKEFERELSGRTLALVKALLGRAFERGRSNEVRRLDNQRRRAEQKGVAA